MILELQVRRGDLKETRIEERPLPDLAGGQILLAIDKFAITANNVGYALIGDSFGFWNYYPAEQPWGIIPAWGFAHVVASRHPGIAEGERVYGFLPMASHAVMRPDAVSAGGFTDAAPHRAGLPEFYNQYQRTSGEAPALTALEDERCLLFPLFGTSFMLYDYLVDNDFFKAEQILIGSTSSKTGLGLAYLLAHHEGKRPRIAGLTSARNRKFVRGLNTCDEVVTYEDLDSVAADRKTAFMDMAGNGALVEAVHRRFRENLTLSCAVGGTHWDAPRVRVNVEGAPKHNFLFVPLQIAKRDNDWGPGEVQRRAQLASMKIAESVKGSLAIKHPSGAEAVQSAYVQLVSGELPPDVGLVAALSPHS